MPDSECLELDSSRISSQNRNPTEIMHTKERCPQCKGEADSSHVRLVRDSCGHRKCRQCLLKEESGCSLCVYTPVYTELRTAQDSSPVSCLSIETFNQLTNDRKTEPVNDLILAPSTSTVVDPLPNSLPSICCDDAPVVENTENIELESIERTEESIEDNAAAEKVVPTKKIPTFGLKEHIVFTPGNPPMYKCLRCEKSYNNRKAARYHNYCGAPDTEKPHTCTTCGQGFVTKGHLDYHMKSHTGSLPFRCNSCGKGFKQQSKLNRHSKSHDEISEKPFKCDVCEKAFTTKQVLKEHKLSHAKVHFVTCPICSKKLSSQSCLRKHKKLHSDPIFNCKYCGKKFPVKWSLEVHMKTHQRERSFKCKVCTRAFKIHGDLKRHARVHQDDGDWECKICNLLFRRRDNLVRHLKNIHPECPMIVSKRQENEKDDEEMENEPLIGNESCTKSSTAVSHAVSVIRAVPVIQKAETVLVSHTLNSSSSGTDEVARWNSEQTGEEYRSYHLTGTSSQLTPSIDQNFHRESVVHYGSSSLESVCDIYARKQGSSFELPYTETHNQCDGVPCAVNYEEPALQSNAFTRPQVIVAKETCL